MAFAIIVGLHFVALGPVFRSRFHAILGVLMCLLSVGVVLALPRYTASAAPDAPPTFVWACAIGLGNAVLLLGAALVRMRGVQAGLDASGAGSDRSPRD